MKALLTFNNKIPCRLGSNAIFVAKNVRIVFEKTFVEKKKRRFFLNDKNFLCVKITFLKGVLFFQRQFNGAAKEINGARGIKIKRDRKRVGRAKFMALAEKSA
ncbi:hypothetical protein OVY01_17795 [Robbsia sp. Bb-Pol-6]|uniref:Ribosomal protein L14 n=1 Tax=Robbsia betulipollinis TaxID=2981849 RepID=A0ABT3ZR28_9BURK|nr:hypothetical protein [Robbsia betulipollinis]MCY0389008.1 hypothetical protein [Robbsia betulipollinis]